jgi:cytoskeletal protein CcmA (bactofilin family)
MMLAEANADADESHTDRVIALAQEEIRRLSRGHDASQPESTSSVSSGLSIVGKIIGRGALTIFGHVEGELRASSVVIAEGAQMEGDVVAEVLTINGHVKGTIHANRVRLGGTGVVEGDILHQTLAIDENARFEGISRRSENAIDSTSLVQTSHSPTLGKGTEHLTTSIEPMRG